MALSANNTTAQNLDTANTDETQRSAQTRDSKSATITNATFMAAAAAAAAQSSETNAAVNAPANNGADTESQETRSNTGTNPPTNSNTRAATDPNGAAGADEDTGEQTASAGSDNADSPPPTNNTTPPAPTPSEATDPDNSAEAPSNGNGGTVVGANPNNETPTGNEPAPAEPGDPGAVPTAPQGDPIAPSLNPLPTEGMVKASVIQPSAAGDIVGFKLTNITASANPSEYVTFGQAFEKGDVQPGDSLVATIDGQKYAVQMDVKTLADDGSVSHAILTLKAPDLAASASLDAMLSKGTAAAAGADLTANSALSAGLDVKLSLNVGGTNHTLDAATVLRDAIAAGNVETWMSGPQASEYRVTTAINDHLKATFDIRTYANGEIKTDVIVSNETTDTANPKTYTYDVSISEGGSVVHSETGVQQWRGSTWHKEVWKNDEPDVHVSFDMGYLGKAGAIMGLDSAIGVEASVLADMQKDLDASDTSLMGKSLLDQYMPGTGGRPDIGPTTQWAAAYLASQDPRALEAVLAQADAGGSIPWHYRDEATGEYVRIDQHPDLWLDPRASGSQAIAGGYDEGGGWNVELAHQPSLSYIPYLVTGNHYYLDEVQAQASFNIAASDPEYRGNEAGIKEYGQIRALAWGLRDIADAMYVTPDSDPMQKYYEKILDNNLKFFVDKYITNGEADITKELEGYFFGDYRTSGATASWQQDYLVMALGRVAGQGNEDAAALLGWMTNYIAGRYINGDYGFDPLYGPAYDFYVGSGDTTYSTWEQAFNAADYSLTELDGYPTWAGGYAAGTKGALATLITRTHDADAYEAYGFVASQTTGMVEDYANNPTFSVAPLLKDGTYLNHDHISVHNSASAGTLTGTTASDLLHGGSGNDTISGDGGIDLLYGANGTDTINGGDGDDWLFGGAQDDTLIGGNGADFLRGDGGNDTMTGGAGADTFSVDIREKASNTITDFQAGEDKVEVAHAYGADATAVAAQILAGATTDGSGNVVLHLASGNDVTLDGVAPGSLTAASLFVTS